MNTLKPFIILQFLLTWLLLSTSDAHAIVVLAPVAVGVVKLTMLIVGFSTLPLSLLSAVINIEKLKRSKTRFILVTILTWIVLLTIIGVVTYLLLNYFEISIQLPF